MKILLIFSLFYFAILQCVYSQTLSFGEMKSLLTKDISQTEDFLIRKNLKFYNQNESDGCITYDFAYNQNIINENAKAFVFIKVCSSDKIIFQELANEKNIPIIKIDAINEGFKYIKTDNYENKIVHIFSDRLYYLLIMSRRAKEGFTTYEIAIGLLPAD